MNQVKINRKKQYNIDKDRDGNIIIDGETLNWDIRKFNDSLYHIIYEEESFIAELVKLDTESKEASFKINNYISIPVLIDVVLFFSVYCDLIHGGEFSAKYI
jgi:hypothetical protein